MFIKIYIIGILIAALCIIARIYKVEIDDMTKLLTILLFAPLSWLFVLYLLLEMILSNNGDEK